MRDVVAAIDAALADNSISPDAMRSAPDAPEPAPGTGGQFAWLPESDRRAMESLAAWVDGMRADAERAVEAVGRNVLEHTRRASEMTPSDFALMPPPPETQLDEAALNRAFSDATETFRRAGEQLQARGGMGFSPQMAIFDEVPAPEPLVTYEPVWPPPFVAYTPETAITMEAPGE